METIEGTRPKELSAVDRAIERSLQHITSSREDLLAAGITEEQIQAARSKAEERVRAHFKELERQDPISRIGQALTEVAQTDNDRRLAEWGVQHLQWERERIARKADQRYAASDLEDYRRTPEGWKSYAVVKALAGELTDGKGGVWAKNPDLEFSERFLRKMGVLEEGESLKELLQKPYPEYDKRHPRDHSSLTPTTPLLEKPAYQTYLVTQLPTNIDGIEARVDCYTYAVEFSISPDVFSKIQPSQSRLS